MLSMAKISRLVNHILISKIETIDHCQNKISNYFVNKITFYISALYFVKRSFFIFVNLLFKKYLLLYGMDSIVVSA